MLKYIIYNCENTDKYENLPLNNNICGNRKYIDKNFVSIMNDMMTNINKYDYIEIFKNIMKRVNNINKFKSLVLDINVNNKASSSLQLSDTNLQEFYNMINDFEFNL